ncbi:MAG: glycosyltransferase family 2 protein, partial [Syntrophaceae bacterium]|nr:glycosyltransferase family 2 protein [Syntrophaceae bacterium]
MVDHEERPVEVSVVMPCLNEAETLAACIDKAKGFFTEKGIAGEIIVADNGSSDGSQQIAVAGGARVVSVREKGYGAALMGGIAAARGTYVVMGDADDSYHFSEILPFIEKLREGYDLVMGCRFPRGGGRLMPGAMPWKHQWIGNPVLTAIGRLFFKAPVSDFHCGLRAFRRDAYDRMDLHTTGMEFASEMVVKSSLKGMKIAQVPVTLYKDGRSRPPHLRSWRDGWRHLRFMLLYSPRWLFLIPGILLFLLGALLGGALLLKGVQIGGVILGTNSLLVSAMAVLVGFQLILFALFTKVFAISEGLLPEDPRLIRLNRYINLEVGLLAGGLVALVGFSLILAAFLYWRAHGYGPISYPESLKLTIPGITAFTLGIEIVFSSFFLSIL